MRPFGSLIDKTVNFREPSIPGARLERIRPPVVPRLDEGITELFDYACITQRPRRGDRSRGDDGKMARATFLQ
jgi:hypothetical protein